MAALLCDGEPTINAMHDALQHLAYTVSEYWSKRLEDGCTYDGLNYIIGEMQHDYDALTVLYNEMDRRINEYRKAKRDEKQV